MGGDSPRRRRLATLHCCPPPLPSPSSQHIIDFYGKAKAYEALSSFYEACAALEIGAAGRTPLVDVPACCVSAVPYPHLSSSPPPFARTQTSIATTRWRGRPS